MGKEFRRARPGEVPTQGGDDELLDDPPSLPHTWSLQAYAAGTRVRALVFGSLIVGTVGAGSAGYWYVGYLQEQERRARIVPSYDIDPHSVDDEDRILYWSEGRGRFGLYREPPGVRVVVLPDRTVQLAEGYDHAQFTAVVTDGRTVDIKVLTGRIEMKERATPGSAPTREAKAP